MSSIRELGVSSEDDLKNYLRMSDECVRILLNFVKPFRTEQNKE
jgi:hypothetical protein